MEKVHLTELRGGGEILGVGEREINMSGLVAECDAAVEILTRRQTQVDRVNKNVRFLNRTSLHTCIR